MLVFKPYFSGCAKTAATPSSKAKSAASCSACSNSKACKVLLSESVTLGGAGTGFGLSGLARAVAWAVARARAVAWAVAWAVALE